MKLSITCFECDLPEDGAAPDGMLYAVQVRDDSIYNLTCRRGHKTVTVLQEEKFEILFEIALNAIVDGYYRDAVASATSSLERFYAFFVGLVCHEHKVPTAELEGAWKHVKNMSERQLGMFIAAHLLHFKKAPNLMPEKRANFRNDVIHKGRIPLKEEAVEYANEVLGLIRPLLIEVKKTMTDSVQTFTMGRIAKRHEVLGQTPRSTLSIASAVSLTRSLDEPDSKTIEASLKRIERNKYRGEFAG